MSVIEMHSSWLAINSVLGCTNNCKYCLLQATNDNCHMPKILATPKEAVIQLLNYKYYDVDIPICLLPNTDAFLNNITINYLIELLNELSNQNIENNIIIITKCKITEKVVEIIKQLKDKGLSIVFYISYSGLGKELEPNIDEETLKNNFRLLKKNNIDIIHYFRPFLPQNSNPKRIKQILDFVNEYTDISVTTGLALIENFINKIACWEEIKDCKEQALKANCVWPESAWKYFNENYNHNQQVFQTNTCALNTKLKKPSLQYFNTFECKNYNHCSEEQRNRCREAYKPLDKNSIIKECEILLKKIGFNIKDVKYIFDDNNSLELKNIDLKISDASYLSYKLGIKVYTSANKIVKDTYNSSLNGAKPLILKGSAR